MNARIRNFARRFRNRVRSALGYDIVIRRELRRAVEFHGTDAGGWSLLANSLAQSSTVVSVGIGEDASFDLSVIGKYNCCVHGYDPTPKSGAWVKANCHDERFRFHPEAIADHDGVLRLYLPKESQNVSASIERSNVTCSEFFEAPCRRLSSLMQDLNVSSLDVLKLDIEGAEYGVIRDAIKSGALMQVKQLLIEFHHWIPEFGLSQTRRALQELTGAGFQVAWVSPMGYEVLFVRDE
jgi:FkbM family methyltransferase